MLYLHSKALSECSLASTAIATTLRLLESAITSRLICYFTELQTLVSRRPSDSLINCNLGVYQNVSLYVPRDLCLDTLLVVKLFV